MDKSVSCEEKLYQTIDSDFSHIKLKEDHAYLFSVYYEPENMKFLIRSARKVLASRGISLKIPFSDKKEEVVDIEGLEGMCGPVSDLINGVYEDLQKHSDDYYRSLCVDIGDWQRVQTAFMKNHLQYELVDPTKINPDVVYPKLWSPMEVHNDSNDSEDELLDLSDIHQVKKGDGLDFIFESFPEMLEDVQIKASNEGVEIIPAAFMLALSKTIQIDDDGNIDRVQRGYVQSVFGISEIQLKNLFKLVKSDEVVNSVVLRIISEPRAALEICRDRLRCTDFIEHCFSLMGVPMDEVE